MKDFGSVSNNKDVVTKEYVDTQISTQLGNIETILATLTTGGGVQ